CDLELNVAETKIKTAAVPCIVGNCTDRAIALTVASNGNDIRKFLACQKHDNGVFEAVSIGFGMYRGYLVAHYKLLG
ncbi:MAG: hypothetical protein QME12_04945, partial [Nanoarchaeota archaeon]|nr:hypothetical protein [Nanoarchaeota archaeon]